MNSMNRIPCDNAGLSKKKIDHRSRTLVRWYYNGFLSNGRKEKVGGKDKDIKVAQKGIMSHYAMAHRIHPPDFL